MGRKSALIFILALAIVIPRTELKKEETAYWKGKAIRREVRKMEIANNPYRIVREVNILLDKKRSDYPTIVIEAYDGKF